MSVFNITTPVASLWTAAFSLLGALAAPTQEATLQEIGANSGILLVQSGETTQQVRLYGVAALEPGQAHELEARTYLMEAAMAQTLRVEVVARDTQDTPIAWVHLPDGTTLNENLLRRGLAWWDRPNTPGEDNLRQLTADAIGARTGLWAKDAPLAPWDYRARLGLEPVRYAKPAPAETPRPPAEPTPTLKSQGTATKRPATESPDPPAMPGIPEEYMALVGKHQPRIARDNNGNALGLTASDIAAIPGAGDYGFQNGDIVQSVNGIAITNELQLLGLVGQLQDAEHLDLNVVRGGKPVQVRIPLK